MSSMHFPHQERVSQRATSALIIAAVLASLVGAIAMLDRPPPPLQPPPRASAAATPHADRAAAAVPAPEFDVRTRVLPDELPPAFGNQ